jgi:hypothetical protein
LPSFLLQYLFGILSCLFLIDYFSGFPCLLISSFISWIVFSISFICMYFL